ncbi:unnamed protein product [Pleuronectes platessa]|uniref:Uncharacterized protein n=1 Tax=Pleuronectes platessa TaxID=8262 RepID=A0A9N7V7P8_PLEPL|nr:unnamed protein product [Pleuronectes platessa]
MSLDCGEEPEYPEKNWSICNHRPERPPPNLELNLNQEPFCHETTVLTTAPLCHPEKADASLVLKYTTNKATSSLPGMDMSKDSSYQKGGLIPKGRSPAHNCAACWFTSAERLRHRRRIDT